MNQIIFNFFFSLSDFTFIKYFALFASNILIYILLGILVFYILFSKKPVFLSGFLIIGAGMFSWICSKVLKLLFHIPRPFVLGNFMPIVNETGFSMPSTHTTIFVALSVIVYSMNRKLGFVFWISTFFICVSRVVLGVHYPVDILVGAILGTIIGLIFVRLGKSPRLFAILHKSL